MSFHNYAATLMLSFIPDKKKCLQRRKKKKLISTFTANIIMIGHGKVSEKNNLKPYYTYYS